MTFADEYSFAPVGAFKPHTLQEGTSVNYPSPETAARAFCKTQRQPDAQQ